MPAVVYAPPAGLAGSYHQVVKGETLWRISRQYGVDIEELTRLNKISDSSSIEVGQRIFIPDNLRGENKVSGYSEGDDFIWPLKGRIVGSFGQSLDSVISRGIRISPGDSGEVLASRSGRVVFSGKDFAGFNRAVILDHGDGLFTVYGLDSDAFVRPGENVSRGAVIARITGRSGNDYLYFEIRKGHSPQNPVFYLP